MRPHNLGIHLSALCLIILITAASLFAQEYELGAQFSGMHLHKIDEAPLGIGLRLNTPLWAIWGTDLEAMHYPSNTAGNFGETSALAGIRIGKAVGSVGIFGNIRPGVIHFGGEYFQQRLDQKTHFILNVGGTAEFYPNHRTFLRIEMADAIIYYGGARLFNRPNPDALGTVHNFQPGFGVGLRF